MQHKYKFLLELKIITFLVLIITILSSAIIVTIYFNYKSTAYKHFEDRGEGFIHAAANGINPDNIKGYLATGNKDDKYNEVNARLHRAAEQEKAAGIYVFVPEKEGLRYIYNSDTKNNRHDLGELKPWNPKYMYLLDAYLKGEEIPPLVMETEYGEVFIVYAPLYTSQGDFAGYISADYSLTEVKEDFYNFLLQIVVIISIITLFIIILSFIFIRHILVKPIKSMAQAARQYMVGDPNSKPFLNLNIDTNDELELLQDSLKNMEIKTCEYIESLNLANQKAETDPLTQILNRGAFEWSVGDYLQKASLKSQIDAFILIDFDEFKSVNDTYGHAMGDKALKTLASLLKKTFRDSDVVARIGGDEFAVFGKNIGDKQLIEDRIKTLITNWRATSFEADGKNFSATLSIGIAFSPSDGSDYMELYEHADLALYSSKKAGRDRYTVYNKSIIN